jgi:hypothetical protein
MGDLVLRNFKRCLTVVGSRTPSTWQHHLQMVVNYLKLGHWMTENGFEAKHRMKDRLGVFDAVAARVQDRQVLYLEFGVWRGAATRYWSKALRHPGTVLHGFDSFEGLPEDFDVNGPYQKGTFDVGGQIPQIDDARVRFFKGWFSDTLPAYEPPPHEVLVIIIDADLYSSTKFVLDALAAHIRPGTFIYFDDLSRPEHEARAMKEFMSEQGRRFRLVAADCSLNTAFFECIG